MMSSPIELHVQRALRALSQQREHTDAPRADIDIDITTAVKILCKQYKLRSAFHRLRPSLVSLHYEQLQSDLSVELVQECRGIVLDASDNWNVRCLPYKKFFNYGESHARGTLENMDWSTARAFEKLDGSLMTLYSVPLVDGESDAVGSEHGVAITSNAATSPSVEWLVASSGRPDAAGQLRPDRNFVHRLAARQQEAGQVSSDRAVDSDGGIDSCDGVDDRYEGGGCGTAAAVRDNSSPPLTYRSLSQRSLETMADLFWDVFRAKGYVLPPAEYSNYCFMFELMSPAQVVQIVPERDTLVLHGIRNMATLEEISITEVFVQKLGWDLVQDRGRPTSIDEVVQWTNALDVSRQEGFVVVDSFFNRVKVKSPTYVALSLLQRTDSEGLNVRRMCQIVRANEGSEFCSYFPQWRELYSDTKLLFDETVSAAEALWKEGQEISARRQEFATFVNNRATSGLMSSLLWALASGKFQSVREYFSTVDVKAIEKELKRRAGKDTLRTHMLTFSDAES